MRLLSWFKKRKLKKGEMIHAYKQTFGTYSGRLVLADISRHGLIDEVSFDPTNNRITDFNEGRRAMALHILNMLQLNPNDYVDQFYIGQGDSDDERRSDEYITTDGLDFG